MGTGNVVPTRDANALAKNPRNTKELLQSKEFESAVAAALPKHLKVERFMRVALNALLRQPELVDCSKESLFLAMLQLSALGLEPDGRRAHLIPFWNNKFCICNHPQDQHKGLVCQTPNCGCNQKKSRRDIQLIVDYKGIAELVRRSGDVSYMHADAVREADEWDFKYGSGAFLTHKPNLEVADRGRVIAFYSFVKLRDGNEDFIVMGKPDVDAIRKRSKAADSGPWVSDYNEMGKKTVFRNHSKWLPLSAEIKDAVESDDELQDTINASGALSLAGSTMIGSETVEEHDSRIERQIQEQGEPDIVSAAHETKGESPLVETQFVTGVPPWPDRQTMLAAFHELQPIVGVDKFFEILGSNGIEGDDDLKLNADNVVKAFGELRQAIEDAKPKAETLSGSFNFGKRGNRK